MRQAVSGCSHQGGANWLLVFSHALPTNIAQGPEEGFADTKPSLEKALLLPGSLSTTRLHSGLRPLFPHSFVAP